MVQGIQLCWNIQNRMTHRGTGPDLLIEDPVCHSCPESRSDPPNSLMDLLQVLLLLLNRLQQSTHSNSFLRAEVKPLCILQCQGTSSCQPHGARHAGRPAAAEEQKTLLNCPFQILSPVHGVFLQIVSFSMKKERKFELLRLELQQKWGGEIFPSVLSPSSILECRATVKVPVKAIFWSKYTSLLTGEK